MNKTEMSETEKERCSKKCERWGQKPCFEILGKLMEPCDNCKDGKKD